VVPASSKHLNAQPDERSQLSATVSHLDFAAQGRGPRVCSMRSARLRSVSDSFRIDLIDSVRT
jgi:hypothetical protein